MSYTREKCKEWAKIPKEIIELVCHELAYHYEILIAFANGATIEERPYRETEWRQTEKPSFSVLSDFRIKEPWKPEKGEDYFFIATDGCVLKTICDDCENDKRLFQVCNCFKTQEEAFLARERVIKALKGDRTK